MQFNHDCLGEHLRDYKTFTGKALYLTWRPADSWDLIHKYAFRLLGEFVAVLDDRDPRNPGWWIITDYERMRELLETSKEIPTAAPELVAFFASNLGTEPDRWELSAGWAASVKGMAARPVTPLPTISRFSFP